MGVSLDIVDPAIRDVDFGSLTITDTMEQLGRLRDTGKKVVPVRFHEETAWVVLDFDSVAEGFMNEPDLPAAAFYNHYTTPWLGRIVSAMRGDEHRVHRSFFGHPLMPGRVRKAVNDVLLPTINGLIDGFGSRRKIKFVSEFSSQLPFRVITGMLDLPAADNDMIREKVHKLFMFPWDPDGSTKVRLEMMDYLLPYIEERRKNPKNDLISFFATTEVDGKLLDDDTLMDFVRFLWPAAGENTQHGVSLTVYHALAYADVRERVATNEKDRAALVEECLRIDPPVTMITRYTEKPVTIAGVDIPAGVPVLLGIGGANRDPRYFEKAEQFSLDRGTINHITFGRGPHFCLGAHLARAEMRGTIDMLIARLPGLRLTDPSKVIFQGGMQRGPAEMWIEFDDLLAPPEIAPRKPAGTTQTA